MKVLSMPKNEARRAPSIYILISLVFLPFCQDGAFSQPLSQTTLTPKHSRMQWTDEVWVAKNDKPFLSADQALKSYVRLGKDPGLLMPVYESLANSGKLKMVNSYKWGMSLYYSSKTKPRTWRPQSVDRLLLKLKSLPLSHSASFDRMRFLVEAAYAPNFDLKPIALRLLAKYPHDDEIKYSILPSLNVMGNASDGQTALRLMTELVAENPHDARAYARLSAVYYDTSIRSNTRINSLNAIAAYKKYLAYAKPNDPFYDRAKYLISVLQRDLPAK